AVMSFTAWGTCSLGELARALPSLPAVRVTVARALCGLTPCVASTPTAMPAAKQHRAARRSSANTARKPIDAAQFDPAQSPQCGANAIRYLVRRSAYAFLRGSFTTAKTLSAGK